jgi:hypothetical protein
MMVVHHEHYVTQKLLRPLHDAFIRWHILGSPGECQVKRGGLQVKAQVQGHVAVTVVDPLNETVAEPRAVGAIHPLLLSNLLPNKGPEQLQSPALTPCVHLVFYSAVMWSYFRCGRSRQALCFSMSLCALACLGQAGSC